MKKKIFFAFIGIIVILLSFSLYRLYTHQQHTIINLFNSMDISKLSTDDVEKKMEQSSKYNGYKLEKKEYWWRLVEANKNGASLTYQKTDGPTRILIFEADSDKMKNSKISDEQIEKVKIGDSFQEVSKLLGSPTMISKDQTNKIGYARWSNGVGNFISYRFNDKEKVK